MSSYTSYPKIFNLGHKYLSELFLDPVLIEEKIDGSQFSFGMINGELKFKSHHADISNDPDNGMFKSGMDYIRSVRDFLHPDWTYRGEYLKRPKHNCLAYDRIPKNNIIIFDINNGEESYLDYTEKDIESFRLGLEVVPKIFYGKVDSQDIFKGFLERTSVLGGQKIEGVVVKNYSRFGIDKKALMGKYVSEKFKEHNKENWGKENPQSGDIVQQIITKYKTNARWEKAVIHLREQSLIEDSPKDIGAILKEIQHDFLSECKDEVSDTLFEWAWKRIRMAITAGLPDWYKARLLDKQFSSNPPHIDSTPTVIM